MVPHTTAAVRIDFLQEQRATRPMRRISTKEMHEERIDIVAKVIYFLPGTAHRLAEGAYLFRCIGKARMGTSLFIWENTTE